MTKGTRGHVEWSLSGGVYSTCQGLEGMVQLGIPGAGRALGVLFGLAPSSM